MAYQPKILMNCNLKMVGIRCSFKIFLKITQEKILYKKQNIVPKVEKGLYVQAVARIQIVCMFIT